ncbi:hypothetical protein [Bacillus sp. FJAT-27264]|uniref:hypothetical protein n=1 Tax=Paenibacillus sp. (strain DSM 101736 / FJAT-27264) TaxID=1850362 RepID=UPI001586E0E2|nr:hypothetical protein [Bacillus sp. FJAT-27264]
MNMNMNMNVYGWQLVSTFGMIAGDCVWMTAGEYGWGQLMIAFGWQLMVRMDDC